MSNDVRDRGGTVAGDLAAIDRDASDRPRRGLRFAMILAVGMGSVLMVWSAAHMVQFTTESVKLFGSLNAELSGSAIIALKTAEILLKYAELLVVAFAVAFVFVIWWIAMAPGSRFLKRAGVALILLASAATWFTWNTVSVRRQVSETSLELGELLRANE